VNLRDWLENGWLIDHETSPAEIADRLAVTDRDLGDCESPGLSPDWKLAIAYNAALQAATAALAASGYRASREAHHYRTIQSLRYTVEAGPSLVATLDKFRKKRNIGGYERAGVVSEQEAQEMLVLARRLRNEVKDWLHVHHPELMRG
jgi:hypothetical protein